MIFYEVGQTGLPVAKIPPTAIPTATLPAVAADAAYRSPKLPVEQRVDDLLARMSLVEKIGQMTQVEKNSMKLEDVDGLFIGSILSGGGGYPATANTPPAWARMVNAFQSSAVRTRLHIPILYGVDAIHGHNSLMGSVIFPHNIGLGAANDPDLMKRIVHVTPSEMIASGIKAGAQSVMISYSSWNGIKMHAQKHLITDVLKGELGFTGFVVSDWGAIDQISPDYYTSVVTAINAGVDMNMVPTDYKRFLSTITEAIQKGDIPMARIDDAVRRILRVKFEMGLFEHPFADVSQRALVGSDAHRAVAQEAVSKSMVLLKNDNQALPLSTNTATIYVGGVGANDIGMQSGGWTIDWQGKMGAITTGTTILDAIKKTVSARTTVKYAADGKFDDRTKVNACVAVVGEQPYAEGVGDKADLALSARDIEMTENMRASCSKLIVILISGRPMIVTDQLLGWDAFVAAWLPGTEGQGVANVLFGKRHFTGKLSFTWPRSMDQLPFDFSKLGGGGEGPLFPYGFGLTK